MFIAETVVSAFVGYILVSFFIALLFFRKIWGNGEDRVDVYNSPWHVVTVHEQRHSCMTGCVLLGIAWPVSVSIYSICCVVKLLVQGMLFVSDKFTGGETK